MIGLEKSYEVKLECSKEDFLEGLRNDTRTSSFGFFSMISDSFGVLSFDGKKFRGQVDKNSFRLRVQSKLSFIKKRQGLAIAEGTFKSSRESVYLAVVIKGVSIITALMLSWFVVVLSFVSIAVVLNTSAFPDGKLIFSFFALLMVLAVYITLRINMRVLRKDIYSHVERSNVNQDDIDLL